MTENPMAKYVYKILVLRDSLVETIGNQLFLMIHCEISTDSHH